MSNSLHMKDSEISSFCRGIIAGDMQEPPPTPSALWVFTKLYRLIMPLAISGPHGVKIKKKKKDEVIKPPCAPGRCYRKLKCFAFWEEMSRGDAVCYLSCEDLPGGRTMPYVTKCCWVGILRLDGELGRFVTGYTKTRGVVVRARLRTGPSLGQVL